MLRILTTLTLALFSFAASAQIGLKPLENNPTIISFLTNNPGYVWNANKKLYKWGTDDTLNLPFFEDFTSTTIYPDSSRWRDNYTYVNRDMAINPPSYGVATFDYLDEFGVPYSSIEPTSIDSGDVLTSQAINLADSFGSPYTLADSIILSFFYQCRGLGDLITEEDSLRLEFMDNNGSWNLVWSAVGRQDLDFHHVVVLIEDTRYLHNAFQFRFKNITHRWGNNNHWHLDYIYLNSDRSVNERYYDDYAIQSPPTSLLKRYTSVPYDHFLAQKSEAADSAFFFTSNRNDFAISAEVRYSEEHDGSVLESTVFSDNVSNIGADSQSRRGVPLYKFENLSGNPVIINRKYEVREQGRVNPVLFQVNDAIETQQVFERYYAYDDGTAESGFGFNDLREDEGNIAIRFDLLKADTLRAIAINLNYNIDDPSRQRIQLKVWSDIEFNGGQDVVVFERQIIVDSIWAVPEQNGFKLFEIDPVFLEAGSFYVGWSQTDNFNLGVGFDKNYGYLPTGRQINKDIFYHIGDKWIQNSNKDLKGAPMIRPVVGAFNPWSTSAKTLVEEALKVYPNPTTGLITIPGGVMNYQIIDLTGTVIVSGVVGQTESLSLSLSDLSSGMYLVSWNDLDGNAHQQRIVKAN